MRKPGGPKPGHRIRVGWATAYGDSLQRCGALESPSSGSKVNDGRFNCARATKERRKRRQILNRESMETFPTIFVLTCTVLVMRRRRTWLYDRDGNYRAREGCGAWAAPQGC